MLLLVDRMLNAGAIPIGRTNLPEMGMRLDTDNPLEVGLSIHGKRM